MDPTIYDRIHTFPRIVYSYGITKEKDLNKPRNFPENSENGFSFEDSSPLRQIISVPQTFRQTIPRRKSCLQLLGQQFHGGGRRI